MDKARELIQEMQPGYEEQLERTHEEIEELKIEINTLLHDNLPSDITIGQSEALAVCIYQIITTPKDFLTTK